MRAYPIYRGDLRLGMEGPSGRQYRQTSFGCLQPSSRLRELIVFLVESTVFERLTMLAVLANCALLALEPPPGVDNLPHAAAAGWLAPGMADSLEVGFILIFTAELLFRVGAMGFYGHEHSYLADGWNCIDAVVVGSSWLTLLLPKMGNFSAARGVRLLRPLRTITRIPGLRRQVITLLDALTHVADVSLLFMLILIFFGILGMQLFRGQLLYRCYMPGAAEPLDPQDGVCAPGSSLSLISAGAPGEAGAPDAVDRRGTCAAGEVCGFYGHNPHDGTVSFDNIVYAWITIFQVRAARPVFPLSSCTRRGPVLAATLRTALVRPSADPFDRLPL